MKTITGLSGRLREGLVHAKITQAELKSRAGISQRTLTNVLSGKEDFKVSTLLALADRLGLELLLVPKGAATALAFDEATEPVVKSVVTAALEQVQGQLADGGGR